MLNYEEVEIENVTPGSAPEENQFETAPLPENDTAIPAEVQNDTPVEALEMEVEAPPLPAAEIPPCEFEDSENCYWDAATMGNGEGASFVDVSGTAYYEEAMTEAVTEVEPNVVAVPEVNVPQEIQPVSSEVATLAETGAGDTLTVTLVGITLLVAGALVIAKNFFKRA